MAISMPSICIKDTGMPIASCGIIWCKYAYMSTADVKLRNVGFDGRNVSICIPRRGASMHSERPKWKDKVHASSPGEYVLQCRRAYDETTNEKWRRDNSLSWDRLLLRVNLRLVVALSSFAPVLLTDSSFNVPSKDCPPHVSSLLCVMNQCVYNFVPMPFLVPWSTHTWHWGFQSLHDNAVRIRLNILKTLGLTTRSSFWHHGLLRLPSAGTPHVKRGMKLAWGMCSDWLKFETVNRLKPEVLVKN